MKNLTALWLNNKLQLCAFHTILNIANKKVLAFRGCCFNWLHVVYLKALIKQKSIIHIQGMG